MQFPTDTANFRRRRMLKSSIMSLKFSKIGNLAQMLHY